MTSSLNARDFTLVQTVVISIAVYKLLANGLCELIDGVFVFGIGAGAVAIDISGKIDCTVIEVPIEAVQPAAEIVT